MEAKRCKEKCLAGMLKLSKHIFLIVRNERYLRNNIGLLLVGE